MNFGTKNKSLALGNAYTSTYSTIQLNFVGQGLRKRVPQIARLSMTWKFTDVPSMVDQSYDIERRGWPNEGGLVASNDGSRSMEGMSREEECELNERHHQTRFARLVKWSGIRIREMSQLQRHA